MINATQFTVCPDDPGILFADDISAARMIREDGIRLVHIRPKNLPEVSRLFREVSNPEFFQELAERMQDICMFGATPEFTGLKGAELKALKSLNRFNGRLCGTMARMGIQLDSMILPTLRVTFDRYTNSTAATSWHTDPSNVVALTVDGVGTEYMIGAVTPAQVKQIFVTKNAPAHVRVGRAEPGDILVMRGRKGLAPMQGGITDFDTGSSKAIFHRGVKECARRTVLLYPFD